MQKNSYTQTTTHLDGPAGPIIPGANGEAVSLVVCCSVVLME